MKPIRCLLGKVLLTVIILPFFISLPLQVQALDEDFSVDAAAAFAVDYDTGKILYSQNSDEILGIASMTKLISAYIVYDEVANGNIAWEDTLPISDYLVKLSHDPELSNIPIENNQVYTVHDALTAALVSSANSLTSALAEYIAGSEVAFVGMMHETLEEWGINDALLVSASGLGNEYIQGDYYPNTKKKDENLMSAKDMAIVATHLIHDYPEVLEITAQPYVTLFEGTEGETTLWSSNDMLEGFDFYTKGVDGLKTGTTPIAGACFVGTIERNNQRIITVVMGVDNDKDNRFEQTLRLIDYLDSTWTYETVIKKGEAASQKDIPVKGSKYKTADLIVAEDVSVWVSENDKVTLTFEPTTKQVNHQDKLKAPFSKKTVVGNQYAVNADDQLGFLDGDAQKTPFDVTLADDLEKDNIFIQAWYRLTGKA